LKRLRCAVCGTEAATQEMYGAEGKILCTTCVEKAGQGKEVLRLIDPTVCARCGRDEGSRDLPRLGRLPMCEECTRAVRNVPFPA